MAKPAQAPIPLAPGPPAEVFAAAAHALCRERGDLEDGTPSAVETDTAIDVDGPLSATATPAHAIGRMTLTRLQTFEPAT